MSAMRPDHDYMSIDIDYLLLPLVMWDLYAHADRCTWEK